MGQGRAVMLLYGLLNNRVEIHARALDLWSTAISKPGLTTVIPGGGDRRRTWPTPCCVNRFFNDFVPARIRFFTIVSEISDD